MKKLVALTLCGALVLAPLDLHSTIPGGSGGSDTSVMAICLFGTAAAIGGYVYFKVRACRPKYYCVKDEDGNTFPSNASRSEREENDWSVQSGPYNSAEEAKAVCPPKTNTVQLVSLVVGTNASNLDNPGVYIPAIPIKIWKSTNLVDWVLRDTILDDPQHFTWEETNAASAAAVFYKASY